MCVIPSEADAITMALNVILGMTVLLEGRDPREADRRRAQYPRKGRAGIFPRWFTTVG
jgi:hypothetical protein